MATVVPAIIPESFTHLKEQVALVRNLVERVQVDIVDGIVEPPKTWPFNDADNVFEEMLDSSQKLPFREDVNYSIDMMVESPEKYIDDWIRVGATALIIHHGTTKVFEDILEEGHNAKVSVGFAAHPSTANEDLLESARRADFVQLMGNDKEGYHGVTLDNKVYEQIRLLRAELPDITIGVDIGVSRDTAPKLVEAGVNRLVSGSSIFGADDIRTAIAYFSSL